MMSCEIPSEKTLPCPVKVTMDGPNLDFGTVQDEAMRVARSCMCDPILLSWYDKKRGSYSPGDVSCCRDGEPSWVTYAMNRGGSFSVDINNEDYVFIFGDACQPISCC